MWLNTTEVQPVLSYHDLFVQAWNMPLDNLLQHTILHVQT